MHIRRELLLALFHYAVVFCGATDNDAAANPPVRKRSERRHFSSLRGGPSDAYAADDFDPYMGIPRELRADTDRSFSYMSYISGSMSMGKYNPIPSMSYDIDFPTPSPGVPVPNVLVETVATPTPNPTSFAPTVALFTPCEDPDLVPLEVEIVTDNWVKEDKTSLVLVNEDTEVVVLSYGVDDPMNKFTTYNDALCVPKGKYLLTISDSLGGLDDVETGWSAKIEGVEILYGKRFKKPQDTSISYTIIAGYEDENMTDTDREWLDVHNERRRTFHREHNTTFKELVWSEGLYQAAKSSVESITPTCEPANDINKGDGWGYNAMRVKKVFENPDVIGPKNSMVSWVDRVQKKDFPGSTFIAAMWRGSRYIGCATLIEPMDPLAEGAIDNDGNLLYCHVSICKYARAGVCGVDAENWLEKTLADRSDCGQMCPSEGCH